MTDEELTSPEAGADGDEGDGPATAEEAWGGPRRYDVPETGSGAQLVLHPARDHLIAAVAAARDDGFVQLVDLCAVDYLTYEADRGLPTGVTAERFEVVVMLLNHQVGQRLRLRVQVPESDPAVPSLFELHPGVEAMEREAYDMFGITFEGHPHLSRILMPDDWDGHPLRKDFAVGRIPVQFKGAAS